MSRDKIVKKSALSQQSDTRLNPSVNSAPYLPQSSSENPRQRSDETRGDKQDVVEVRRHFPLATPSVSIGSNTFIPMSPCSMNGLLWTTETQALNHDGACLEIICA
jgi:hypothetical protein